MLEVRGKGAVVLLLHEQFEPLVEQQAAEVVLALWEVRQVEPPEALELHPGLAGLPLLT